MHIILWICGLAIFWAGLNLSDDEAVLISSAIVGSIFILIGLVSAPVWLQIVIEVSVVLALFNLCIECIKRGDA